MEPLHLHPLQSSSLRFFALPTNKVPDIEITAQFKQAVPRLFDRRARDALQTARREDYIKIATMLVDIADARTFSVVDVLITDYNDKLDCSLLPSFRFLIPFSSFVPCC